MGISRINNIRRIVGGLVGYCLVSFSGMIFTASFNTFGRLNAGGSLVYGVNGTTALTLRGCRHFLGLN